MTEAGTPPPPPPRGPLPGPDPVDAYLNQRFRTCPFCGTELTIERERSYMGSLAGGGGYSHAEADRTCAGCGWRHQLLRRDVGVVHQPGLQTQPTARYLGPDGVIVTGARPRAVPARPDVATCGRMGRALLHALRVPAAAVPACLEAYGYRQVDDAPPDPPCVRLFQALCARVSPVDLTDGDEVVLPAGTELPASFVLHPRRPPPAWRAWMARARGLLFEPPPPPPGVPWERLAGALPAELVERPCSLRLDHDGSIEVLTAR